MADGAAKLRNQIRRLRELGTLPERSAPAVARAAKADLVRKHRAGQDASGRPWPLTKKGERPLKNAAKAVSVRAIGSVVLMRVDGHHARHHLGAVKGKIRRRILPVRDIPSSMSRAITRAITREFRKVMSS